MIYLLLLAFTIYQLLPKTYTPTTEQGYKGSFELATNAVYFYYIIASLLDILWIWVWPMEEACASLIVMIALWATLATLYVRITAIGETEEEWEEDTEALLATSRQERPLMGETAYALTVVPFSAYFAWITCMLATNLFAVFGVIDSKDPYHTFPYVIATVVILGFLAFAILALQHDIVFTVVIVWALFGISQGKAIHQYPGREAHWIYFLSIIFAGLLLVGIITVTTLKYTRFRSRA